MYEYSLVRQLTSDDERAIQAFQQTFTGFQYFQSPDFQKVCSSSKNLAPFYILAKEKGRLTGVLLAYRQVQTVLPGLSFLTSRNLILGGPVAQNSNPDIVQGLLKAYRVKAPKSLYTQIRNLYDTSSLRKNFEQIGFVYEEHLNILVDLTCPEDELWKNVHTKRRNEIRRAEREGCRVILNNSPESLAHCYTILMEVYQRAKLPLPHYSHFQALLRQATATSGLRIFTVLWEGQFIGCMLCLVHNNALYDYYAGSYSNFYSKYPNDLLPWEVFKWAKKNGFTYFDFGGAGKPNVPYGVREYKKKFGGQLVNYGRYEAIHFPLLFGLARKLFALWKLAKR